MTMLEIVQNFTVPKSLRIFVAIILGQIISFLLTFTAVSSEALVSFYNVSFPNLQNLFNYIFIGFVYTLIILLFKREYIIPLKKRGIIYFFLAVVDVEASYLVVKAYNYTTITSVMVLDCATLPCVMILSYFIFKERYSIIQIIAVIIAVIGIIILLFSDHYASTQDSSTSTTNLIFGDFLVLGACVLYAISNVGQQYMVTQHSFVEYLCFLGQFGTIICGLQLVLFNNNELVDTNWQWEIWGWVLFYGLSLFFMYSLVPFMLRLSNATVFNLSLLTADAYSLFAGIFIFNESLYFLYFVSLFVTLGGLILYNLFPKKQVTSEIVNQDELQENQRDVDSNHLERIDQEKEAL